MERQPIPIDQFEVKCVDLWLNKWLALTCGTEEEFNSMTIAWGSIGGMWAKPFVQVVVRPTRYTYEFMEKFNTFTLCAFPEAFKEDLLNIGSKSGRDSDKISETRLHIVKSKVVSAPSFKEADIVIECRKIYWQDMEPMNFLDASLMENYPQKDFHRIYFGEILHIEGK
jgi:flavin reductase (DIM6/NTAB) family NADH-FMN oxidoreductase RutF